MFPMMLTRTHPLARRVRALRGDAALRRAEGVVVAEGIHLAVDALRSGVAIEAAIFSSRLLDGAEGRELDERLRAAGVALYEAAESTLDQLQDARSPQPVVTIVTWSESDRERLLAARDRVPLVVAACGVQEPGNLGALWRTADAAGGTGFFAATSSAGLIHPRTVRASMGSIFRLPAAEGEIESFVDDARNRGFAIYGADARDAIAYDAIDWTGPIALLFGGEGAGLPPKVSDRLDARVHIPMAPGVESLSVNAAAAVLLFEAARRRKRGQVAH